MIDRDLRLIVGINMVIVVAILANIAVTLVDIRNELREGFHRVECICNEDKHEYRSGE